MRTITNLWADALTILGLLGGVLWYQMRAQDAALQHVNGYSWSGAAYIVRTWVPRDVGDVVHHLSDLLPSASDESEPTSSPAPPAAS